MDKKQVIEKKSTTHEKSENPEIRKSPQTPNSNNPTLEAISNPRIKSKSRNNPKSEKSGV